MRAMGFAKFRGYWTTEACKQELLKEGPSLTIENKREGAILPVLDRAPLGKIRASEVAVFPIDEGTHRIRFRTRSARGREFKITVARACPARIELLDRGKGPPVEPALPAEARQAKRQKISTRYLKITISEGRIVSAVIRKTRTRAGGIALGIKGQPISYDEQTWALLSGLHLAGGKHGLYASDRLGTYVFHDEASDAVFYRAALWMLTPKEYSQRHVAIERLGSMGDRSVLPAARAALGHENPAMRRAAAGAMAALGGKAESALLRRAAQRETSPQVKEHVKAAVQRIEDRARLRELVAQLQAENERKRFAALDVLKRMALFGPPPLGDVRADVFVRILEEADSAGMREGAAESLGQYRSKKVIAALLSRTKDESEGVRVRVASTLANLQAYAAGPAIEAMLHDKSAAVRAAAANALGRLGLLRFVPGLTKALEDEDKWVRNAAANALRRITRQSFGFDHAGGPGKRNEAIRKWRAWWEGE